MAETPLPVAILTDDVDLEMQLVGAIGDLSFQGHKWNDFNGGPDAIHIAESIAAHRYHAVCIGPDVPTDLAFEVGRCLDQYHPDVGVVLLREATAELWREGARAGIRDIVEPGEIGSELIPAVLSAAQRSAQLRAAKTVSTVESDNRVIVVLSPKGGSGKTMLSTNLGMALSASDSGQSVIVDLDCVFGDVASVMGMVPEHTIGELAMVPSFDSTTLKVYLTRHERSGLFVLAGSGMPEEGEAVTDEIAGRIIDLLTIDFPHVIVDTASGLDERALAAIERATDLVFLASMDVASIRNLGKEIDALDRVGFTDANRHFILNRADARVGLEVGDVEKAVGLKVDVALPSSRLVPLSMNQGRTLVLDDPDCPVSRELITFADRFLEVDDAESSTRSSRFSLWRR
jgi:pilus assembly protein CpaE